MAVYQDKEKGTWRVVFRYTDFTGERTITIFPTIRQERQEVWGKRFRRK